MFSRDSEGGFPDGVKGSLGLVGSGRRMGGPRQARGSLNGEPGPSPIPGASHEKIPRKLLLGVCCRCSSFEDRRCHPHVHSSLEPARIHHDWNVYGAKRKCRGCEPTLKSLTGLFPLSDSFSFSPSPLPSPCSCFSFSVASCRHEGNEGQRERWRCRRGWKAEGRGYQGWR